MRRSAPIRAAPILGRARADVVVEKWRSSSQPVAATSSFAWQLTGVLKASCLNELHEVIRARDVTKVCPHTFGADHQADEDQCQCAPPIHRCQSLRSTARGLRFGYRASSRLSVERCVLRVLTPPICVDAVR